MKNGIKNKKCSMQNNNVAYTVNIFTQILYMKFVKSYGKCSGLVRSWRLCHPGDPLIICCHDEPLLARSVSNLYVHIIINLRLRFYVSYANETI